MYYTVVGQNISTARAINTVSSKPANYVELQIKDNGLGISQEDLDKIFDPYFSTKQQGSGLGLATTHSIIGKHDGHIRVQSTPGVGTTFTVALPAASRDLAPAQQAEEIFVRTRSARILVMDDDELVRDITQKILKEMGHEVLSVKDGMEAVQIYQESIDNESPIDLTIMDLTIPGGMGGQEAVQQILSIDPNAKVIVTSGYSNDPVMANFKDYGFCSAITKPHHFVDLEKAIKPFVD